MGAGELERGFKFYVAGFSIRRSDNDDHPIRLTGQLIRSVHHRVEVKEGGRGQYIKSCRPVPVSVLDGWVGASDRL